MHINKRRNISDFLNGFKSIFISDEAAVDSMTQKVNMECCMGASEATNMTNKPSTESKMNATNFFFAPMTSAA